MDELDTQYESLVEKRKGDSWRPSNFISLMSRYSSLHFFLKHQAIFSFIYAYRQALNNVG